MRDGSRDSPVPRYPFPCDIHIRKKGKKSSVSIDCRAPTPLPLPYNNTRYAERSSLEPSLLASHSFRGMFAGLTFTSLFGSAWPGGGPCVAAMAASKLSSPLTGSVLARRSRGRRRGALSHASVQNPFLLAKQVGQMRCSKLQSTLHCRARASQVSKVGRGEEDRREE